MFVEEDFDFGFIQEKNKQTFIVSFRFVSLRFVSSLFLSFSLVSFRFVSFRKAFRFVSQSTVSCAGKLEAPVVRNKSFEF